MNREGHFCTLNLLSDSPDTRPANAVALSPIARRLAKGFAYLDRLDRERAQGRNPMIGSFMEHIIVRRELVELEFQLAHDAVAGSSESPEGLD